MVKVAFVTPWPIDDDRSWSGAIRPMFESLADRVELVPVSTAGIKDALVDRAAARFLDGRWGRRYHVGQALSTSVKRGIILGRRLREVGPDAVLAVAASQDVAFLGGAWPVVQVSDLTFQAAKEMYPDFQQLHLASDIQARTLAHLSGRRTAHTLAATDWALELLINEGSSRDSVTLAPFGPCVAQQRDAAAPARTSGLRLLSVISNWVRKGGDRVLAIHERLLEEGVDHQLTIVGEAPCDVPPSVSILGRVNREAMAEVYANHHLLLEPARANASGVTLTDAAAFGLPAVVAKSGGVETIVIDGCTGRVIEQDGRLECNAVSAVMDIAENWERYSKEARHRSLTLLNWSVWSERAAQALRSVSGVH